MPSKILDVPQYYPQTDSRTAHADRMCFSSTMAMGIKYLWPDSLKGSNADDDYLKVVLRYGDTTIAENQIRAAQDYNVRATLFKNGTLRSLRDRLDAGLPVPVAFLHHGPASSPRGSGHWVLLIGRTDTHVVVHDPYGELDNVNGGYVRRGPFGKAIKYSLKNWLPRWQAGGEAWFMDIRRIETVETKKSEVKTGYNGTFSSVKALADKAGARWPEVVAAQWALESGWGKHPSGKNNFFGIKGSPGTIVETTEFIGGKWIKIEDEFKDYPSPEDCIQELVDRWYKDYRGFKGVNRAPSAELCCHLLRIEGYATDPKYPEKLIRILQEVK